MDHDIDSDKETTNASTTKGESGWQIWQGLYSIRRKKVFLRIVDGLKKHLPLSR